MQPHSGEPAGHGPFASFRLEHVRVLAQLDELEGRALAGEAAEPAALHETLALLAGPFTGHMAAEDAVLYPAIQGAFPAGGSTLEALRADHAELRLMLAALTGWLAAPPSAARDEQLRVVLRDFVDLLRLHIHREESAVFDVASRVLSNSEAEELARRIAPPADVPHAAGDAPGPAKGSPS